MSGLETVSARGGLDTAEGPCHDIQTSGKVQQRMGV
jgi:hypothetical protein